MQRVETLLIDDLDGGEATETVPFGYAGTSYEIDLSAAHAREMREKLAKYISAGRRVAGSAGRPGAGVRPRGGRHGTVARAPAIRTEDVRDWARGQGFEVKDRGRVPGDLIQKYLNRDGSPRPADAPSPREAANGTAPVSAQPSETQPSETQCKCGCGGTVSPALATRGVEYIRGHKTTAPAKKGKAGRGKVGLGMAV